MQDENLAQPQEGTNPEVVVETTESTPEVETVETPVETKTYSEEEFKQVLARAKKAEEALKKNSQPNITNKTNTLSAEEVDVKILQSQGYSDELISELKAVAKARGRSLFASTQDPIFLAIKAEKENEVKAQKAKLGASKGSATAKKEKDVNSVGLSEEEHRELWKQMRDK